MAHLAGGPAAMLAAVEGVEDDSAAGAATVLVSANPAAPLASLADVHLGVDTGPEVIAGSTRMKAASAQMMVLNAFSTAVLVATGRTHSNLMVELVPLNAKLRRRQVLPRQASGAGRRTALRRWTGPAGRYGSRW